MKTEEGKSMEKAAEDRFPDGTNGAIIQREAFIAGWQQCQQEGDKEISKLQESLLDVVTQSMKEIERLKGLIETIVRQTRSIYPTISDPEKAWQKFKSENNL